MNPSSRMLIPPIRRWESILVSNREANTVTPLDIVIIVGVLS